MAAISGPGGGLHSPKEDPEGEPLVFAVYGWLSFFVILALFLIYVVIMSVLALLGAIGLWIENLERRKPRKET